MLPLAAAEVLLVWNTFVRNAAGGVYGTWGRTQISFSSTRSVFRECCRWCSIACVYRSRRLKTGLGLKRDDQQESTRFDRKNYFTIRICRQVIESVDATHPIVGKGEIEIERADGSMKVIGITRLHLEQDAGISLHDQHSTKTFIDLNRADVALMEIVSEPEHPLITRRRPGAYA